jgi:hypothetical protein
MPGKNTGLRALPAENVSKIHILARREQSRPRK